MDFNDEIKISKLIIELTAQYKRQADIGDIQDATETLSKLTKIKMLNPTLFNKVQLLTINDNE